MNTRPSVLSVADYFKSINWKLLLFLLLFLNVKLVIKLAALIIIYLLQPNVRFGFKLHGSRLPLFYPAVIIIAAVNWMIYKGFSESNQSVVFITGICFWLACLLAIHQIKIFTDTTSPAIIYKTLILFFIINAAFSLGEIIRIVFETGALNPYRYQGNYQKYFISTGDYIKGVTLDTSVTNAALNSFGVIFFLFKRNTLMVLLCMLVLLITASNLTNILLFAVLVFLFLFKSDREQKSTIAICFFLLVIFLAKVSPQNNEYLAGIYGKLTNQKIITARPATAIPLQAMPDNLLSDEEKKEKLALLYLDSAKKQLTKKTKIENSTMFLTASLVEDRPIIPEPSIHSKPFQSRNDTNETRRELLSFKHHEQIAAVQKTMLPGKLTAIKETFVFFRNHPIKVITGNGMGNFSSKLALRVTTLGFAGGFPKQFAYVNPDFKNNHLALYISFFSDQAKLHSVLNSPNSVYVQLLGEYGIAGLMAFALLYVGYFFKQSATKGYALPLLFIMLGFFFTDYWFEQLSIVILFELLLFLNKQELLLQND